MLRSTKTESLLSEAAEKIEIQGLKEIHEAGDKVTRFIWTFVLVGAVLLTGYYSYKVVGEYVDNNKATKVSGAWGG
jgi:hypothetical protein